MQYSIFFAVLLKVIQYFGLLYFYSIPPTVPQSQTIGEQNWSKADRWNKYDRIHFIAASLHYQTSLLNSSAPLNRCYSIKQYEMVREQSTANSTAKQIWGCGTFIMLPQQYRKPNLGSRYFYYVRYFDSILESRTLLECDI